jgi:hypothetical protein
MSEADISAEVTIGMMTVTVNTSGRSTVLVEGGGYPFVMAWYLATISFPMRV